MLYGIDADNLSVAINQTLEKYSEMFYKLAQLSMLAACLIASAWSLARASNMVVIDGDTIKIAETTYRLHGIDTPEAGQKFKGQQKAWACGQAATARLVELTEGR